MVPVPRARTALACLLALAACRTPIPDPEPDYERPLPPGAPALLPLGPDEKPPSFEREWERRDELRPALERSIQWTQTAYARSFFPIAGVTHERAVESLIRFRELLDLSTSARAFDSAIRSEFTVYKSAGWDGRGGGVLFTGYCTPILDGRTRPDAVYRHPLYGLPEDLVKGADGVILGRRTASGIVPYPDRATIEATSLLSGQGLELAWMRDPIDAYIAHVNGSAFIDVGERDLLRLGYAGKNGRPYASLGEALVEDGRLRKEDVNLASIRQWARANPHEVEEYLRRNPSYVFFTHIDGNPRGSLNVEVTPERTVATDKTLFPRGAITFVAASLPRSDGKSRTFEQFMFDQDTGGAIRTAGRADLYLGIGDEAEALAGTLRSEGQLYYLFLAE
jgi:membrane-bound lytic murein transglycosylase A